MSLRVRAALVLSALLAALAPSVASAAGSGLACKAKPTAVHAFHIEAEWTKKAYRASEKAVVTLTVTRPAHEDPADLGVPFVPPVSVPEAGATVWTTINTGHYPYPYGYGVTDANGQITFKIGIEKLKPGPWDASHSAEKWTNQGGCPDIYEWGYLYQSPAFKVVR
jgi:hypothetical protein